MRWFVGGAPGYWLRADDGRLAEKLAMPVACDPASLIGAAAIFSTLRTFSYIRRDSDGHVPFSFAQIGHQSLNRSALSSEYRTVC
jgi:hypothetical protein